MKDGSKVRRVYLRCVCLIPDKLVPVESKKEITKCYGLNCVSPQFVCCSPQLQDPQY